MGTLIDGSIIGIFLLANLLIGIYSSKHADSFDRFSVGHRAFNSFAIFATLSASFIGGGYTMGNAAKVYQAGMIYAFALLGFSLKEILVGLFVAPHMDRHNDCLSVGDIIAKSYGKLAKWFTGIFSVLICMGILGAQVGAMAAIFDTFFQVNALGATLISFAVILVYSSLGGMRAVVYTDILQFIVLIIGIPLIVIFALVHFGGWQPIVNMDPTGSIAFWHHAGQWPVFIGLFLTFMFGEALVPPYVQRLFMAKSAKHTRSGTLWSGLISIPFFLISGSIGLIALAINAHITPNNAVPFVIKMLLPIGVRGFVIAALVAIIMSSAAGFLNAGAVAFVNDMVRPIAKPHRTSQQQLLRMVKWSNWLIGVGSIVFALSIQNILEILLHAYNFWSPVIVVPLLAVLLNRNVRPRQFFIGAACGVIAMLVWSYALGTPFGFSALVVGVAANLLGFLFAGISWFRN